MEIPINAASWDSHSFDYEPGTASNGNRQRFYVFAYASWISPGILGGGFQDVTALSHEIAETFNDPFVGYDNVHNITPWWTSGGECQDLLETGDVLEGLPNATYPITMHGYTYHPQNEALLPWFEFRSPSTALHGAYSYPDETLLTGPLAAAEGRLRTVRNHAGVEGAAAAECAALRSRELSLRAGPALVRLSWIA